MSAVLWPDVYPAQVRSRRKYVTAQGWLTFDYISMWALKGRRSNGQGRGEGCREESARPEAGGGQA